MMRAMRRPETAFKAICQVMPTLKRPMICVIEDLRVAAWERYLAKDSRRFFNLCLAYPGIDCTLLSLLRRYSPSHYYLRKMEFTGAVYYASPSEIATSAWIYPLRVNEDGQKDRR
jgi:hypothetical protein